MSPPTMSVAAVTGLLAAANAKHELRSVVTHVVVLHILASAVNASPAPHHDGAGA